MGPAINRIYLIDRISLNDLTDLMDGIGRIEDTLQGVAIVTLFVHR